MKDTLVSFQVLQEGQLNANTMTKPYITTKYQEWINNYLA
jgi:hypothetical protein